MDQERFYRSGEKKIPVSGRLKHFLNVQHRTSNNELASLVHFIKNSSMPYLKFDVGRWMFDVHTTFRFNSSVLDID